jgi:S-sulfo-L-cysteine synthase (O-acetyl-L-serine-dependent)
MIYKNVLEMIGNTPLLQINKIVPKSFKVYAKIEGLNPGGSIKDRVALKMIEEGEKSGELSKNKTIIEATSGNTGIALAMIGAIKGYNVLVVMSEAVSSERRKLIRAFGAEIILTEKDKGTDGAIVKVRQMIKENPDKYFYPDQFVNMNNKLAHYEETAKEIARSMEGKIDYFVAPIGTSGTLMGVGQYLKEINPSIKIISAEPVKGHYIQGLKNMKEAIMPEIYDRNALDQIIKVDSEEAFAVARKLIKEEGISVGMSSGAAMLAVLKLIETLDHPARIVTVFPDRGEKYLSTSLFNVG